MYEKMKTKELEFPAKYRISLFPESFDFVIPGFEKCSPPGENKTLGLKKRNSEEWFNEFIDKLINACGHQFLPVCRISDGEFHFFLGEQSPDIRLTFIERLKQRISSLKAQISHQGGVGPNSVGHYHSGKFTANEWRDGQKKYPEMIRKLSEKGILALHLNYTKTPFNERNFPAFEKWVHKHNIFFHDENYFPFYFVYAFLTGPRRLELFKNRKVLVVNGAQGIEKQKIIDGIWREDVSEVFWLQISLTRSMYDLIDVSPYIGKVDFAIVGAGIGKPNIMLQMESLNVPCIDAGYVFEVWKDPANKFKRMFCASDDDWDKIGSNPFSAGI